MFSNEAQRENAHQALLAAIDESAAEAKQYGIPQFVMGLNQARKIIEEQRAKEEPYK